MAGFLRENGELVDTKELDQEKLKAVKDSTRRKILENLAKKPDYPSNIAEKLGISKQKAHYHFKILKQAEIIEKVREEKHSGGLATYYRPVSGGFILDFGGKGEKTDFKERSEEVKKFLNPLIKNGELNGKIVVGSPDRHGPDQVRARDGYLAGEIGFKLGSYATTKNEVVVKDTELVKSSNYSQNMLLLGGILTNTVSKKFNHEFSASFEGEEFPYREIKTPRSSFTGEKVGIIAKTVHPEKSSCSLFLVAGVRNEGTKAAVIAFKNLENLIEQYMNQEAYIIVKGQDIDGDGEIDSYEVLEKEGVK